MLQLFLKNMSETAHISKNKNPDNFRLSKSRPRGGGDVNRTLLPAFGNRSMISHPFPFRARRLIAPGTSTWTRCGSFEIWEYSHGCAGCAVTGIAVGSVINQRLSFVKIQCEIRVWTFINMSYINHEEWRFEFGPFREYGISKCIDTSKYYVPYQSLYDFRD